MTLRVREVKCIEKDQLTIGKWYAGVGRNSNVGLWDGKVFITVGYKFGMDTTYHEPHWDDEGPFQPFDLIHDYKV